MNVSDFDYLLPEELIAQQPSEQRDGCRLLVLHMDTDELEHRRFSDIKEYLRPGDCLVLNDSKVIPARLFGIKEGTGAHIEFLLSKKIEGNVWETLVRPGKRLRPGDFVSFADGKLRAEILENSEGGTRHVRFTCDGDFMTVLEELGSMPLPPYIERASKEEDKDRYQTVYAKEEGSVAAPTAGLHFTKELLEEIKAMGVKLAFVTLHVGIGTFRPVKVDKVEEHHMHFEEYHVSEEAAQLINETKAAGGRIISVGTTACRTMESAAGEDGLIKAGSGNTGIFIYPGYKYKMVDCLITNFHLPKSTLLMLVSALYDREHVIAAYNTAVEEKYRFFSYGDACFFTK
ncbi:MAG: tRNA preQ1(34) S-adenosylmethionine ribosyltransferase-isomerase QueA [Clostridia bacterium]|nr:tRNA preQ1(34) S-adenosylmethionine ribosyltransferase-isomerase QueA [Clostridia bacterium]